MMVRHRRILFCQQIVFLTPTTRSSRASDRLLLLAIESTSLEGCDERDSPKHLHIIEALKALSESARTGDVVLFRSPGGEDVVLMTTQASRSHYYMIIAIAKK